MLVTPRGSEAGDDEPRLMRGESGYGARSGDNWWADGRRPGYVGDGSGNGRQRGGGDNGGGGHYAGDYRELDFGDQVSRGNGRGYHPSSGAGAGYSVDGNFGYGGGGGRHISERVGGSKGVGSGINYGGEGIRGGSAGIESEFRNSNSNR